MSNSDVFLSSFNRIEKWMREEMGNTRNMGFTELVRRLARKKGQWSVNMKKIYFRWRN